MTDTLDPFLLLLCILLSAASAVADGGESRAADDEATAGLDAWHAMQPPTPGYSEQVFYHDISADADGYAALTLRSPATGLGVNVACRKAELPLIVHWKMMGQGAYVTGLEPSNCRVGGRAEELEREPHCVLDPGAAREFSVRIRVRPLD